MKEFVSNPDNQQAMKVRSNSIKIIVLYSALYYCSAVLWCTPLTTDGCLADFCLTLPYAQPLTLYTHTLSYPHTLSPTHTHSLLPTHTLSLPLAHMHTLSLIIPPSLSFSLTLTLSGVPRQSSQSGYEQSSSRCYPNDQWTRFM